MLRNEMTKVSWDKSLEALKRQVKEFELYSVGRGEPLKDLEQQSDKITLYFRKAVSS